MDGIAEFVNTNLLPHWPFVAAMMIFMVVGQVMKTSVFPKEGWKTRKPVWLFWWGRKTLALHPVFAGMVLGLFWRAPEPGVLTIAASCGYFALAGTCSVWAYEILKAVARKEGVDINLPGVDDSTPPPA
jgi:hypothetical protein